MTAPSQSIIDAIDAGLSRTTSRVEFYESDGVTAWEPGNSDESRLISGTVGVDYTRDERRSLDIMLDNIDNALRPDPEDGLWYDKVIKTYRGVKVNGTLIQPKIALAYPTDLATAVRMQGVLAQIGYTDVTIMQGSVGTYAVEAFAPYDLIIVTRGSSIVTTWDDPVLEAAYALGKSVMIQSPGQTASNSPLIWATNTGSPQTMTFEPAPGDSPLHGGWTTDTTYGSIAGSTRLLTVQSGVTVVARKASSTDLMAALIENSAGGRWFAYQPPGFDSGNSRVLLLNAMRWLTHYSEDVEWETQLGEFMIDNISEDSRPYQTKITGRDYTKKCILSKLEQTLTFDADIPLETFVRNLGANSGVTKFKLPVTSLTIGSGMSFDRTTPRWDLIKKACDANNYEVYFDQYGYLTMREYLDPVTSPFSRTFLTGPNGNLVKWTRSTNDSRLYNHIIITGDSGQEDTLPFFGEARNEEPSSPTRIQRIGDRSYFYTSAFFTSDQQCIDMALRYLKEKALESYELSWDSLTYPWMEVGEIVEFLDPRRLDLEPTRFLMDTLSIPLGLGSMSATGKRVTYVNDPGLGA